MLLSSAEMLSVLYSAAYWLLPHLLLLVVIYFVVRAAVRTELNRKQNSDDSDLSS